MKKQLISFVGILVLVFVAIVVSNLENGGSFFTAGNNFWNLNKENKKDTAVVSVFFEANQTSDQPLAQGLAIMSYEHGNNGLFIGTDLVGCASTEFNVMCPTYDMKFGADFTNGGRLECKVGNFTRNSVKTNGFDPQFGNFCTLAGDPASVSNAVQLSYTLNGTKLMVGHQAGSKFYQFNDGNYYIGAEQRIGNFAISGGADFTETVTGYAAAQVRCGKNVFNVNCNKLGTEAQNYIVSYNYNGISLGKGYMLNLGSAFYKQTAKSGVHVVAGLCKNNYKLFAQFGGYKTAETTKSLIGLGLNVKL